MDQTDTNPKTKFGLTKPQLHLSPSTALEAMAGAFTLGAQKYGAYNWRERTVSASTYISAAMRHIAAYQEGEEIDRESGHPHLGHAMACLAILVDAGAFKNLIDDRPKVGRYRGLLPPVAKLEVEEPYQAPRIVPPIGFGWGPPAAEASSEREVLLNDMVDGVVERGLT